MDKSEIVSNLEGIIDYIDEIIDDAQYIAFNEEQYAIVEKLRRLFDDVMSIKDILEDMTMI